MPGVASAQRDGTGSRRGWWWIESMLLFAPDVKSEMKHRLAAAKRCFIFCTFGQPMLHIAPLTWESPTENMRIHAACGRRVNQVVYSDGAARPQPKEQLKRPPRRTASIKGWEV